MRKLLIFLFIFPSLLTGCGNAPVNTIPTPVVDITATNVYKKIANSVFKVIQYNERGEESASATAFVIKFDGKIYFLTAKHVLIDSENVRTVIVDKDGKIHEITSFKLSESEDIASFEVKDFIPKTFITLASKNPEIGSDCFCIGNPLDFTFYLTKGIVSQYYDGDLMAQAPIAYGSSGGVLVDSKGKLIGITSATIPGWSQFNFFVPVEDVSKFLKS